MCPFSPDSKSWLVADIGGTNSRCAVLQGPFAPAHKLRFFRNADYPDLAALLRTYLADFGENRPRRAALAVAAPIHGDDIRMINLDWAFSKTALAEQLGFDFISIINDFEAVAYALPAFREEDLELVGPVLPVVPGNRAVLGAGTGLGVAGWIESGSGSAVVRGEGGHMTLAARNAAEADLIAKFRDIYGHCSAERVLSGNGLIDLHRVMHGEEVAVAEHITGGTDARSRATMQQFFNFFADIAGDVALVLGAVGGVYIAGGIITDNVKLFRLSGFRERFEDKGRYSDYLGRIPTWVITNRTPGIRGLSAYIDTL